MGLNHSDQLLRVGSEVFCGRDMVGISNSIVWETEVRSSQFHYWRHDQGTPQELMECLHAGCPQSGSMLVSHNIEVVSDFNFWCTFHLASWGHKPQRYLIPERCVSPLTNKHLFMWSHWHSWCWRFNDPQLHPWITGCLLKSEMETFCDLLSQSILELEDLQHCKCRLQCLVDLNLCCGVEGEYRAEADWWTWFKASDWILPAFNRYWGDFDHVWFDDFLTGDFNGTLEVGSLVEVNNDAMSSLHFDFLRRWLSCHWRAQRSPCQMWFQTMGPGGHFKESYLFLWGILFLRNTEWFFPQCHLLTGLFLMNIRY